MDPDSSVEVLEPEREHPVPRATDDAFAAAGARGDGAAHASSGAAKAAHAGPPQLAANQDATHAAKAVPAPPVCAQLTDQQDPAAALHQFDAADAGSLSVPTTVLDSAPYSDGVKLTAHNSNGAAAAAVAAAPAEAAPRDDDAESAPATRARCCSAPTAIRTQRAGGKPKAAQQPPKRTVPARACKLMNGSAADNTGTGVGAAGARAAHAAAAANRGAEAANKTAAPAAQLNLQRQGGCSADSTEPADSNTQWQCHVCRCCPGA